MLDRLRLTLPVVGIISIFSLLPTAIGYGRDDVSKEFVMVEYPKALAVLEAKFAHCHGGGFFSTGKASSETDPSLSITRRKADFAFSGANGRLIRTKLDEPEAGDAAGSDGSKPASPGNYRTIFGYNAKSSFIVLKKTPSADYVIKSLDDDPKSARAEIIRGEGHAILGVTYVHLSPISELIKVPGFRWERVTEIRPVSQPRRLKLDFSIPWKPDTPPRVMAIISGWFVVSPEDQWVLHEYGINFKSSNSQGTTRIGHIEYERGTSGDLRPVNCSSKVYAGQLTSDPSTSNLPAVLRSSEAFQFEKLEFGDTPDREFSLNAFGLPEFGQTVAQASSSRSFPWWIIGAAVGFAFFALLLPRLSSRHRTHPGQDAG